VSDERRTTSGIEVKAVYGPGDAGDAARRLVFLSSPFSLEAGFRNLVAVDQR